LIVTTVRAIFQGMNPESNNEPVGDGKSLSKGQLSRTTILLTAAKLATMKGLDGLSIGDLAAEVGMSKSGLYAHFKSKEDLELATIETAVDIFDREVLRAAMSAPAGLQRLRALAEAFLAHLDRRVFPGGCFFAAVAMELDTRPGPARDRVVEVQQMWGSLLTQCFLDAMSAREIDSKSDVAQAVFETSAMLLAANFQFVMTQDPTPLTQAKRGVENILSRLNARRASKKKAPTRAKSRR
jgi:AcrR family transcriptional regulator